MKTIVCDQPGQFSYRERPTPSAAPGQALVRIRRIGICGTDLHAFRGRQPYFSYPRVLGHELAGEIIALGEGVTGLEPGDAVTVIPYLECGDCIACRSGRTNCCTALKVIGVHQDGGMQEIISMPADHLIKATGMSYDELALVECMAIGAHAVRRAGVNRGEDFLVIGAGPIGLGVMQFARIAGARVIALDLDEQRLELAGNWARVDAVVKGGDEQAKHLIDELTAGNGASAVFDATGSAQSMTRGFDYVAHGGRYLLVSIVDATISFYDPDFHRREMTLLSSRNATREDFLHVLRCLDEKRFDLTSLISHRCRFDRLVEEFDGWTSPGAGLVKGMVEI
jgi:2-desacetyl-2-hydroxyethyl bacteriochlorophyllide A dehydrogenase